MAYREMYVAVNGPIPEGLSALHRCNNTTCVKPHPDHVYLGTQLDNIHDAIEAGTHRKPPRYIGESHPNAKLTSEQVADIRSRHAAGGVSFAALGREFGVSGRMASYIVHGRSWSSEM